ncbi:hypothetical protein IFM89_037040, partial [Coptis chinensis]
CHLYRGLDRATRSSAAKGQVVGVHPILEVWFYEYLASMNAILNDVHDHDSWPRMKAWCYENRAKEFHEIHHNVHISRQQIEIRSIDSIRWRPWERSRHMSDGIVKFAATLSRFRVILTSHDHKAYYLGDRYWRHATGEIAVPRDPPANMLSSKDIPDETDTLRARYIDSLRMVEGLRTSIYSTTREMQKERWEERE